MKRARTSTTTAKTTKEDDKGLSKAEKAEVKKIVLRNTPHGKAHNGPTAGPVISGPVNPLPTSIVALTAINAGQAEYQRRGDQIYIDKIRIKAYVVTTSSNDAFRMTLLRQPRSGFPPGPINLASVWQNFTAGLPAVVSAFQDDQPCQVLEDKTYTLGIAAGLQECRVIEWNLDYTKRPLRVTYLDNSAVGAPANTVMGDIELVMCCGFSCTVTFAYDVTFHEK